MAARFRSPIFYPFAFSSQHTEECIHSRLQAWPFLSRGIIKHKRQHHNFLNHGIFIGHCVRKPQATSDENSSTEAPLNSDSEVKKTSDKKFKEKEEVRKGQFIALLTGAITIVIGVGYLILVQILDTRGIILQPPPPEAFDP